MSLDSIPQLLPLVTVARTLCVSEHTVRAWVRKGKLRPIRICRRLLFHPDEVARFLREFDGTTKKNGQGVEVSHSDVPF